MKKKIANKKKDSKYSNDFVSHRPLQWVRGARWKKKSNDFVSHGPLHWVRGGLDGGGQGRERWTYIRTCFAYVWHAHAWLTYDTCSTYIWRTLKLTNYTYVLIYIHIRTNVHLHKSIHTETRARARAVSLCFSRSLSFSHTHLKQAIGEASHSGDGAPLVGP